MRRNPIERWVLQQNILLVFAYYSFVISLILTVLYSISRGCHDY